MGSVIQHRGPDDEGIVLFNRDDNSAFAYGGPDTPETVYQSKLSYCPTEKGFNRSHENGQQIIGGIIHKRLAIIGVGDCGHQPMCSPDGRYWITYNGEVYNFPEIRRELEPTYPFQGHSDTEVVLAAFEAWGIMEALGRLQGMFAFAVWDNAQQSLHLVRDRIGLGR